MGNDMVALARWCFQRRAWVLIGWLAVLVILGVTGRAAGSAYSDALTLPGTGSTTALTLLEKAFPGHAGDQDTIVWRASSGSVDAPAVRARITAMLGKVAAAPAVASVISPYSAAGAAQVSRNGQIAYATVVFDAQGENLTGPDVTRVIDLAEAARAPGVEVEIGGGAVENALRPSVGISAAVGVVAAAVVLFIAFGSLLAMLLPLIIAIAALVSGLMADGLVSHAVSIPSAGPTLGILIGLGVGIDYALFIVTRHRAGLKAGLPAADAAARALNTSGRAVLFAGTTVCIALLGMLVLRIGYVSGLGIAAAITVLFTVAATVTLLPALLGFLGMRVLSRRERRRLADDPQQAAAAGWWARLAAFVQRHPAPLAVAAAAVMLILAIPVLSLRLGSSDAANDPASTTTHQAYELLADGFGPGFNGPLQLVGTTTSPADAAAFARLAGALKAEPGIAAVSPPVPGDGASLISVTPTTSPEDAATSQLISALRASVIPAAEHGTTLRVYVGGETATNIDFATVIGGKLPIFIAVIIGLSFLLLVLAFRSLLIPAVAAVMNLLAAASSFGVLAAVFQYGWGLRLLNLGQPGPVESFLPVLMLAVLFGLSMDYEVFLVSRIREEWAATGDNHLAVRTGQAATGRVITAAATVMVLVFSAFILSGQQIIGEIGIGLAAAVLLDAVLLRTILVPALMHLFGRANWWLPGWLDRILPRLSIEPPTEPPAKTGPARASEVAHGKTAG
jgi:RND superfamily putative drug exporter